MENVKLIQKQRETFKNPHAPCNQLASVIINSWAILIPLSPPLLLDYFKVNSRHHSMSSVRALGYISKDRAPYKNYHNTFIVLN